MKSTGIVRRIDNLGRVTLPIELRRNLDVDCGDPLEIYTEGASIVLRKHEPNCVFCGSTISRDCVYCPRCGKKR